MARTSGVATALIAVATVAALAGCSAVSGTALPAEPDVRTLEVGPYQVTKHRYEQESGGRGALLEGMRMSEAVVPTVQIDPSLKYGRGSKVLADSEEALAFLAQVSKPVLDTRRFLTGFAAAGADEADPPGQTRPAPDTTAVTNVVLRFPDEAVAKLAARELEDADIGVSPDNQRLGSTEHPDAYIHWRPGIANAGAFIAHREFVVSLFVQRPTADSSDLVKWIDKTLDAQLPALDAFQPTPMAQFDSLKVDPDDLLARVVVEDRDDRVPDASNFTIVDANDAVHNSDDQTAAQRLVEQTGADRVAVVDADSVFRVRDEDAGRALIDGLIGAAGDHYDPIDAPKDVPGAKCLQLNDSGDLEREYKYRCYVPYKRYVGIVVSDKEPDVRQKIAAQYALLANSL
ncbi:DUF7373 family lipoprotein [Nocardia shimofusensis]|uniref:DUF7373 family lipoprotein n=1 Tax=Nocardia shimofusensis TaxID=228596 RepID=UPI00082BE29E|nr:hypothetical protein [Nocardia shimofusensis]